LEGGGGGSLGGDKGGQKKEGKKNLLLDLGHRAVGEYKSWAKIKWVPTRIAQTQGGTLVDGVSVLGNTEIGVKGGGTATGGSGVPMSRVEGNCIPLEWST